VCVCVFVIACVKTPCLQCAVNKCLFVCFCSFVGHRSVRDATGITLIWVLTFRLMNHRPKNFFQYTEPWPYLFFSWKKKVCSSKTIVFFLRSLNIVNDWRIFLSDSHLEILRKLPFCVSSFERAVFMLFSRTVSLVSFRSRLDCLNTEMQQVVSDPRPLGPAIKSVGSFWKINDR